MDVARQWANLEIVNGQLQAFIGGQNGMSRGLMFANKLDFAPRPLLIRSAMPAAIAYTVRV